MKFFYKVFFLSFKMFYFQGLQSIQWDGEEMAVENDEPHLSLVRIFVFTNLN